MLKYYDKSQRRNTVKNLVDEVRYSKEAAKYIKTLDKNRKEQLRAAIRDNLMSLPAKGDIKPMEGYPKGTMRLRVGSYRIVFRYDDDGVLLILNILKVGPRGDIYK